MQGGDIQRAARQSDGSRGGGRRSAESTRQVGALNDGTHARQEGKSIMSREGMKGSL